VKNVLASPLIVVILFLVCACHYGLIMCVGVKQQNEDCFLNHHYHFFFFFFLNEGHLLLA